jgi:transcription-repair coupling factor (superfamily II helicase)
VQIDLPITAHLPREYVARDDVRMEAYRRLAAVESPADVDDVRAEWEDRYGPPPPPAEALLAVARLRVECMRLGVRAVSVQKGVARLDGWQLRKSQEARLKRLAPRANVVPDAVVVPVKGAGETLVTGLLAVIGEIAPPDLAPIPSAS